MCQTLGSVVPQGRPAHRPGPRSYAREQRREAIGGVDLFGDPCGVPPASGIRGKFSVDENSLAGHAKPPFLAGHGATSDVQVLRTRRPGRTWFEPRLSQKPCQPSAEAERLGIRGSGGGLCLRRGCSRVPWSHFRARCGHGQRRLQPRPAALQPPSGPCGGSRSGVSRGYVGHRNAGLYGEVVEKMAASRTKLYGSVWRFLSNLWQWRSRLWWSTAVAWQQISVREQILQRIYRYFAGNNQATGVRCMYGYSPLI